MQELAKTTSQNEWEQAADQAQACFASKPALPRCALDACTALHLHVYSGTDAQQCERTGACSGTVCARRRVRAREEVQQDVWCYSCRCTMLVVTGCVVHRTLRPKGQRTRMHSSGNLPVAAKRRRGPPSSRCSTQTSRNGRCQHCTKMPSSLHSVAAGGGSPWLLHRLRKCSCCLLACVLVEPQQLGRRGGPRRYAAHYVVNLAGPLPHQRHSADQAMRLGIPHHSAAVLQSWCRSYSLAATTTFVCRNT